MLERRIGEDFVRCSEAVRDYNVESGAPKSKRQVNGLIFVRKDQRHEQIDLL